MSERPLIIANMQYKSPRRWRRGQGNKGLRATLKYLEFRENRDTAAPVNSRERWVDCGLGDNYKSIFGQCAALRSEHVLAWTWVISPEPDVMALLPHEQRQAFVQELTEAVVDRYYEERGYEPQYSYVIHDGETSDGRPHTHSHVILPGTAQRHLGEREAMVNYKSRGHIQLLDDIANDALGVLLERELGPEWEQTITSDIELPYGEPEL